MSLPDELAGHADDTPQVKPGDYTLTEDHRRAAALRIPLFTEDDSRGIRIEALENYLLLAAFYHGQLHEERLHVLTELAPLEATWDALTAMRGKTLAEREESKRQQRPQLGTEVRVLRWRVERLTEEIARLDRDHDKVSRAYTLIVGA